MESTTSKVSQVRFYYEESPEYRVISASGLWGGLTPEKMIFLNLFVETPRQPEIQTHEVTPDGKLGSITENPDLTLAEFRRLLEIGIVITPSVAKAIAAWLNEKADLAVPGD
ncbi:MAG: hypothetical protein WCP58_04445 [bacterium]